MCFFNQQHSFLHSPVGFILSNTAFFLSYRAFPSCSFYSPLFFDSYLSSGCYLSSFRLLSIIFSDAIYHPFCCYLSSFRLLSIILSVAVYHPFGCYLPSFRLLSTILSVAIYHPFGCYLPFSELQSLFTTLPSRRFISTCPSS